MYQMNESFQASNIDPCFPCIIPPRGPVGWFLDVININPSLPTGSNIDHIFTLDVFIWGCCSWGLGGGGSKFVSHPVYNHLLKKVVRVTSECLNMYYMPAVYI